MSKKRRILIVDDDRELLETLSDILKAKGFLVAISEGRHEAMERLKKTAFDVALIDIVMPGVNGVQILKELKRISPQTRVIMMTGYAVPHLIEEAIKEGAERVLYKPLNIDELIKLIRSGKEGGSLTLGMLLVQVKGRELRWNRGLAS
jgi:DNA-binding NtrC family response regulator